MKAKTRRRLLISSIAMLLVAMLALGTATFAWFTTSTSATADGIIVRTSKTSSLQIASATGSYGSGFTYTGFSAIMLPASSIDGTHWFYSAASASNAFTSNGTITEVPKTSGVYSNKYVYQEQLNIKNAAASDSPAVTDIEVVISGLTDVDYIRVAFVPAAEKGANKAIATGEDFADYVYADASDCSNVASHTGEYYPISDAGALQTSTMIETIKASTSGVVTIDKNKIADFASLAAQAELHYNVYVWFEGQDIDCLDDNAGDGVPTTDGITFTVSGTPATE